MDYKKIVKSRKLRLAILKILFFVPDKMMISIQYRMKTGHKMNWKRPKRFTEKLQWYKLYYRDPLMRQCANKYLVRSYVASRDLSDILVPLIGIYDDPNDIDFKDLPIQFVAKDTLGVGGNGVILCKDKQKMNIEETKEQMLEWVNSSVSYKQGGREWCYGGLKHQIIIEKMLPSCESEGGLIDWKFFCFDGEPAYLYVISDRKVGKKAQFGIYTLDFEKLDVIRVDEEPLSRNIIKPENFAEMINIAKMLAKPFPEVRIDLYSVNGKIYFGEMTFFDGSGYMTFDPDAFDVEMGNRFILPTKIKKGNNL